MKKLTCPVCDRPEIEGDICPNCETDLTLIRMLAELSPVATTNQSQLNQFPTVTLTKLSLGIAILILVVGISLGTTSSYLLSKSPQKDASSSVTAVSPTPISNKAPSKTDFIKAKLSTSKCADGFRYKVRRGDYLLLIAKNFYGNKQFTKVIVKANPQLKNRENNLNVGEILLIPNLEEHCQ